MTKTRTAKAQKPNLPLKVLAVLIGIKGLFFLACAIYAVITNLL